MQEELSEQEKSLINKFLKSIASKGGKAVAEKMSSEERIERARKGGLARGQKYKDGILKPKENKVDGK